MISSASHVSGETLTKTLRAPPVVSGRDSTLSAAASTAACALSRASLRSDICLPSRVFAPRAASDDGAKEYVYFERGLTAPCCRAAQVPSAQPHVRRRGSRPPERRARHRRPAP